MSRLCLRSSRPARNAAAPPPAEPQLSVAPPAVGHVGLILRDGREHFGANLRDIANALRIRVAYVQAIEEGRFDDLPGPTYAAGFVRAYSDFLGFDTELLIERFKVETSALSHKVELDFPIAPPEGRFPGRGALLFSLLVAGVVLGGWYYMQIKDEFEFERVPAIVMDKLTGSVTGNVAGPVADPPPVSVPLPEAPIEEANGALAIGPAAATPAAEAAPDETPDPLTPRVAAAVVEEVAAPPAAEDDLAAAVAPVVTLQPPVPARPPVTIPAPPVADAAPEAPQVAALPQVPVVPAPAEAAPPGPRNEADPVEPAEPVAAAAEAEGDPFGLPSVPRSARVATSGRVYGMPNRDVRIIIIATVDSWIQIRDATRSDVFTRMLRAGDSYRVPDREGLILMTGNAGGLMIEVDGEAGHALGDAGVVARDVALDPEELRARLLRQ